MVIAASGPSQNRADLDYVRGKARVIAVNRTWELAPWADVLYSGDPRFWATYRPDFAGLKVAGAETDTVHKLPDDFGGEIEDVRGWLPKETHWHNSGAQAIVYAAWWGARRISLTGFDMAGGHWHADHNNSPMDFPKHIRGLALLAPEIKAMGVEVINCSRQTAVRCFPRARLEDVI